MCITTPNTRFEKQHNSPQMNHHCIAGSKTISYLSRARPILAALLSLFVLGCESQTSTTSQSLVRSSDARDEMRSESNATGKNSGRPGKSIRSVPPAVSQLATDWIYHPRFFTEQGDALAGLSFFVELEPESPALLFTSDRLIGRPGGLYYDTRYSSFDNTIQKIALHSIDGNAPVVDYTPLALITLERFGPMKMESSLDDLAIFQFPSARAVSAGRLTEGEPIVKGDKLWMLAPDLNEASPTVKPHLAEVFRAEKDTFRPMQRSGFPFRQETEEEKASPYPDVIKYKLSGVTSQRGLRGAPLVNSQGEVVAIHSYSWRDDAGVLHGNGNPLRRHREDILQALRREEPGPVATHAGVSIQLPKGYMPFDDGKLKGTDKMWMIQDADLGKCIIQLRVLKNTGRYKPTDKTLKALLQKGYAAIAQPSRSHSHSTGSAVALAGMRALIGTFSVPHLKNGDPRFLNVDVFQRNVAKSGLLMVAVGPEHLLIAKFVAEANANDSNAQLLAKRALSSIQPVKESKQASVEQVQAPVKIRLLGLAEAQYESILYKVLDAFERKEFQTISANTLGPDIALDIRTDLSLQEIADRLLVGKSLKIDAEARVVSADLSDVQQVDAGLTPDLSLTELLEATRKPSPKNWFVVEDSELRNLLNADPASTSSKALRQEALRTMIRLWRRSTRRTRYEEQLFEVVTQWDAKLGKEFLRDVYPTIRAFSRGAIIDELCSDAIVEDVPLAVDLLFEGRGMHNNETATCLLSQFPKEAEAAILKRYDALEDKSFFNDDDVVEFLIDFGTADTLAFFRKHLNSRDSGRSFQRTAKDAIERIQERDRN